jgi:hypothetical protein
MLQKTPNPQKTLKLNLNGPNRLFNPMQKSLNPFQRSPNQSQTHLNPFQMPNRMLILEKELALAIPFNMLIPSLQ